MTFENIHKDIECLCAESSDFIEDDERIFARVIRKPNIREQDFLSHFEKGKLPTQRNPKCAIICSFRGVSVDLWTASTKIKIIDKYIKDFQINTGKQKDSILIFKNSKDIGVCKSSPSDKNPYHHDFYKSDGFDFTKVDILEIIRISDYLNLTNYEK